MERKNVLAVLLERQKKTEHFAPEGQEDKWAKKEAQVCELYSLADAFARELWVSKHPVQKAWKELKTGQTFAQAYGHGPREDAANFFQKDSQAWRQKIQRFTHATLEGG